MSPNIIQLLVVAVIVILLFGGRGKISSIMGDVAKGIRSFRKGLKDEEGKPAEKIDDPQTIDGTVTEKETSMADKPTPDSKSETASKKN